MKITRDRKTSIEVVRFVIILTLLTVVTACAQPQKTNVLTIENERVTPPIEIEITKCYVASDGPHMSMRIKNNTDNAYEMRYKIRIYSDTTKLVRPDPIDPPKEWVDWITELDDFLYTYQEMYDDYVKMFYLDENLLFEDEGGERLALNLDLDFNNWIMEYPIQKNTLPKKNEIQIDGVRCTFQSTGDDFLNQIFPFTSSAGKY